MFKYAPGMESGLGAALNMMRKHAEPDGDEGTTVTNIFNMEDKKSGMNDIAGLMALMQNNKGMDLPGILAPITASVSLVCMTAFPPLRLRALRASSSSTPSCVRPLPKSSRPCATRVTAPTMPRAMWATPCAIAAARLKHSLLPYCAKSVVSSVISANPPASSTPRLSLKP